METNKLQNTIPSIRTTQKDDIDFGGNLKLHHTARSVYAIAHLDAPCQKPSHYFDNKKICSFHIEEQHGAIPMENDPAFFSKMSSNKFKKKNKNKTIENFNFISENWFSYLFASSFVVLFVVRMLFFYIVTPLVFSRFKSAIHI